eukprot:CAMPEP_0172754176 /NCGR_PEP_ID=MMETSP1074-20121228/157423_1 /TAXON_ID=2916 /ORGANISM="Ceratium fusus, Strain PA161109" /LENGTH=516 /DNA_ID=CAMNT_0013587027 /DNA_START=35 /DNA_END=1585 /DNA_ORIENTATION=-
MSSTASCHCHEERAESRPRRQPSIRFASALACMSTAMVILATTQPSTITGQQRESGTLAIASAGASNGAIAGLRRLSEKPSTYQAAYITWARDGSKCLYVSGNPTNGTQVELWECPVDLALTTKFLIPVGIVGPVRLLAHPDYCLEAPGGGLLRISACGHRDANGRLNLTMRFWLRKEAAYWVHYPSIDLPDERDAEHMPAHDLDAVKKRAEEQGYGGFSIFQGEAWLKEVDGISRGDLHWMGHSDPCVFYIRRKNDVTIGSARSPNTCLDVPVSASDDIGVSNGRVLEMSECRTVDSQDKITAMRFVPRVMQLDDEEWRRLRPLLVGPKNVSTGKSKNPATTGKTGMQFGPQAPQWPMDMLSSKQLLNAMIVGAVCLPLLLAACLIMCCCCCRKSKPGRELDLLRVEAGADGESNGGNDDEATLERSSETDGTDTFGTNGEPQVWRMGRIVHYSRQNEQPSAYEVLLDGRGSPARCLQDRFQPGHTFQALDVLAHALVSSAGSCRRRARAQTASC